MCTSEAPLFGSDVWVRVGAGSAKPSPISFFDFLHQCLAMVNCGNVFAK